MKGDRKSLEEEIEEIRHRLVCIEEYLQQQAILDPMLLPQISTLSGENHFCQLSRKQHPGFIPRLRELVPDITSGEEHLCMMIKLNMTTREMACMLNVDMKSIYTARSRLKHKLTLPDGTCMNEWIKKIE